jgi:peptidoglycan hydrolase CwlO-like protein
MDKKKLILSPVVCIFALAMSTLVACGDPAAEAQIAELTAKNAELNGEIQSLQKTLDSLQVKTDSLYKVLVNLDLAK